MRTLPHRPARALAPCLLLLGAAAAQVTDGTSPPIVIPSQTSVFNQNAVTLPTAPSVSGQDVVRGADGTTCQSAVASGGPYLDVGVLQSQDFYARESAALYGRVVVPLGKRAQRVDCTALYKLEIERMRMELELLRMGLGGTDILSFAEPQSEPEPTGLDEAEAGGTGLTIPAGAEENPIRTTEILPQPERLAARPVVEKRVLTKPAMESSGLFIQTGAFLDVDKALSRLTETASFVEGADIMLRPLERDGQTLYRTLLGPLSRADAEAACERVPGDCFIAAL